MNPIIPKTSFSSLLTLTAKRFNLSEADIVGPSRRRNYCLARQIVAHLARQSCGWSYAQIGERLGHRTHATILHACRVIRQQLDKSPELRKTVQDIAISSQFP